jgi:hypothetical protein
MNQVAMTFDGPDTSHEAARRIAGGAQDLRSKVLDHIRGEPDGATDEEIQEALGMNPSTERPRRTELMQRRPQDSPKCMRLGLIRDSGRRRKTRSGCPAIIWMEV